MDSKAIRPDVFVPNLPEVLKDKEAEKRGASDEERLLYTLSESAGWRVLKEYIDNLVKEMDALNKVAVQAGMTFEEIGKNTVVINLAKEKIEMILNKVADAKEACEARGNE